MNELMVLSVWALAFVAGNLSGIFVLPWLVDAMRRARVR